MHKSACIAAFTVFVSMASLAPAERRIIQPEGYSRGLPFTPGILIDGTLYIAGFSGEDPKTGAVPRNFETEVRQALDKIGTILKAGGMDYSDVVAVQVCLVRSNELGLQNIFQRAPSNAYDHGYL